MKQNETKKLNKNFNRFICEKCDFKCYMKCDWDRHIITRKHINETYLKQENVQNLKYNCFCGLEFNSRTTLWRHKKKCSYDKYDDIDNSITNTNIITNQNIDNHIILELVKQNQEFKELLIEQNKQIVQQNEKIIELTKNTTTINNNNNIGNNCHNKTKFNMNFFLNEQCKDALNIMDFVNELQVKLTDLENIGKLGYSEGISKIFINGLKQLDVFKRPIHCSDLKRDVLYIKDEDAWEKENEDNKKIKKAINQISHKNIQQLPNWIQENPICKDGESKKSDEYLQIVSESMGGIDNKNMEKIIHNIAKEVVIDK
jgi:hypothetical protein